MKKLCRKCGIEKPLSDFNLDNRSTRKSRGGFGVTSDCKMCIAERRSPGITQRRVNKVATKKALSESGMKLCSKCKAIKSKTEFHKRKASPDGLAYKCAECIKSVCTEWRKEHPGAFSKWHSENRDHRAKYWADWYGKNKDDRSIKYKEWARANKHIVNSLIAKRNAAKHQQTPSWADLKVIREIYAKAAELTKKTGIRHEVDHIYPLQGKTSGGLHCEANLQILTKTENIRKSNRDPDELYGRQL